MTNLSLPLLSFLALSFPSPRSSSRTQEFFGRPEWIGLATLSATQRVSPADRGTEPKAPLHPIALTIARVLLIVEDDQLGLDLADLLETLGYAVDDILTSLGVPLEEDFSLKSDVVVVDLELHGEAIEAGRLIGARWHRPVVYLVDDVQQAEQVAEKGGRALHVMWPFAPGLFDEDLRSVLPK